MLKFNKKTFDKTSFKKHRLTFCIRLTFSRMQIQGLKQSREQQSRGNRFIVVVYLPEPTCLFILIHYSNLPLKIFFKLGQPFVQDATFQTINE